MSVQYRVYVTPLASASIYGTEKEISDLVQVSSGGSVTRSIDSTNFAIGIYTFNDVSIQCDNADGLLSDPSDSRSLFKYSRDRAKVRIIYDDSSGNPPLTFKGLINDAATVIDSDTDSVTFTVLGPDSVITSSPLSAGTITTGMTAFQAILAALNTSDINEVLNLSIFNITPTFNCTVDDGSQFDNKNKKDALTELLLASNSCLIIDDDWNIFVRSRFQSTSPSILYLYGKNATGGTENIISIKSYNTGLQRVFNQVTVKGGTPSVPVGGQTVTQPQVVETYTDGISPGIYGTKPTEISFEWMLASANMQAVATSIVGEFKYPKIEMEIQVPSDVAHSYDLLDVVSVNYPLRITAPPSGKFLPVIGVTKVGDVSSPLPVVQGAVSIDPSLAFKIIEKSENLDDYTTTLKLRQVGYTSQDGVLVPPLSVVRKTSSYAAQTTDDVILGDATFANMNITLPAPSSYPTKAYYIKKVDSTANTVTVLPNGSELIDGASTKVLSLTGDTCEFTTDGSNWYNIEATRITIQPTVQKLTSGSATYTTPSGVVRIRVRMVGGGGGGAGSGSSPGAATGGGNTTFGTTLLVANGGAASGGSGGTASLGSGPIGLAFQGAQGSATGANVVQGSGGSGGTTPFGGAGTGGGQGSSGTAAIANTGSGGGGAGGSSGGVTAGGSGGSAGGYVDAIITSPSATYSYAVGAAGSGGSAGTGTGAAAGANGAAGIIFVEEYYQ